MLAKNFSSEELQCKCGCSELKFDANLVKMLQRLRDYLDAPVIVTSGYRCKKHNKVVGGVENSYHTLGMASDIYVKGVSVDELAKLCILCGFTGVGLYRKKGFVHVDVRKGVNEAVVFYG